MKLLLQWVLTLHASNKRLGRHRSSLVPRWTGVPPGLCSLGWHWAKCSPQGLQLGLLTVGGYHQVIRSVWLSSGPWADGSSP